MTKLLFPLAFLIFFSSCESSEETLQPNIEQDAISVQFGNSIDLENLPNYENQEVPSYITKDNASTNPITNRGAVLGRILFYDKNLSVDNSTSCASCHKQALAFGDDAIASIGVNGTTGRHSMRLVNTRFSDEVNFFWDERAFSLEDQTTKPIQDHIEMGYSGEEGNDNIEELFEKIESIEYYNELFTFVYGDPEVNELRMQNALAQFIRSIQSFDSKYDIGRSQVANNNATFPNYTEVENDGKNLFMERPEFNNNGVRIGGGLGCQACHRAPEFDIDPESGNNGIVASLAEGSDTEVTRSPSLRDLFNTTGEANGPFMHTGFSEDFEDVLDHYDNISSDIAGLDRRLSPRGNDQNLNMTDTEKDALLAFIKTLSGTDIYENKKWSDPFN